MSLQESLFRRLAATIVEANPRADYDGTYRELLSFDEVKVHGIKTDYYGPDEPRPQSSVAKMIAKAKAGNLPQTPLSGLGIS